MMGVTLEMMRSCRVCMVCMALVLVSTLVVQPLPTDQTGKAFFSLAIMAVSPFVAGWLAAALRYVIRS